MWASLMKNLSKSKPDLPAHRRYARKDALRCRLARAIRRRSALS
jgi:hypothetical protein